MKSTIIDHETGEPIKVDLCDQCGAVMVVLGVLGDRRHFRCEGCGMQFSRKIQRRKR